MRLNANPEAFAMDELSYLEPILGPDATREAAEAVTKGAQFVEGVLQAMRVELKWSEHQLVIALSYALATATIRASGHSGVRMAAFCRAVGTALNVLHDSDPYAARAAATVLGDTCERYFEHDHGAPPAHTPN